MQTHKSLEWEHRPVQKGRNRPGYCKTMDAQGLNELLLADETSPRPGTHDKIAFTVVA